jgi:deoxyadenosine/deoxycytidine kinase
MSYPRIEICGGIASGKTTLALLLQDAGLHSIFEKFRETQFYQAFYEAPDRYAFEAEIDFLLQHYHWIKRHPGEFVVCDYSLWLDRAYARANLSGGQLRAFAAVWREILSNVGRPVLLIYLRCDVEVARRRITARARPEEAGITIEYLAALNDKVTREVQSLSRSMQVLQIDSDEVDFASDSPSLTQFSEVLRRAVATSQARGEKVGMTQLSIPSG